MNIFLGKTKFGEAQKNLGRIAPKCPYGYRSDSDIADTLLNRLYLTKQSSSDK